MLQKIIGKMRKAIEDFDMIQDGDKIAVGLSGGKDSITLLHALNNLRRYYDKKFELVAITIHPGNENFKTDKLKEMCNKMEIEYIEYMSNIFEVVFEIRKEKNPCSLCANMRRGMLNSIAIENGCNKIALGHHMDDVIETAVMSAGFGDTVFESSIGCSICRSSIPGRLMSLFGESISGFTISGGSGGSKTIGSSFISMISTGTLTGSGILLSERIASKMIIAKTQTTNAIAFAVSCINSIMASLYGRVCFSLIIKKTIVLHLWIQDFSLYLSSNS